MAWNYSVVMMRVGGAPVIVGAPVEGWTSSSATTWAHTVARYEEEGTTVHIFRSRGRTGKAKILTHRAYVVRDGITRRTDR